MDRWFALRLYLSYLLRARSNLYLHSPFVFDFYNNVLSATATDELKQLESGLATIRHSPQPLQFIHPISGEHINTTVAHVARRAAVNSKYGRLLYHLCRHYKPQRVLELGTNLGIGTAYLASGFPLARVITVEGAGALQQASKIHLESLGLTHVETIHSLFADFLQSSTQQWNLVYLDGHHDGVAVMEYVKQLLPNCAEEAILVIDDINYNRGMNETWLQIVQLPEVTVSMDLYRMGIAVLRGNKQAREHFTLWF